MRRFLEHRRPTFQHHLLQCGMRILGVVFVLLCIMMCDVRRKFASPNPHVELGLAANVVLSGKVCPLKLAQQLCVAGVGIGEDNIAYDCLNARLPQ